MEHQYEDLIRQEYSINHCVFSGGYVEGDPVDTVYLKLEKDGVEPTILLLRPDEMQALAWICNGVLWSEAMAQLMEIKDDPLDIPVLGPGKPAKVTRVKR